MDGLMEFLLNTSDPRAHALRERFVFLIVPMINPDGVFRGHYRADTIGQNLNRCYAQATPEAHSSVFAI
jgi:murein tripeptide amidase MpaA